MRMNTNPLRRVFFCVCQIRNKSQNIANHCKSSRIIADIRRHSHSFRPIVTVLLWLFIHFRVIRLQLNVSSRHPRGHFFEILFKKTSGAANREGYFAVTNWLLVKNFIVKTAWSEFQEAVWFCNLQFKTPFWFPSELRSDQGRQKAIELVPINNVLL